MMRINSSLTALSPAKLNLFLHITGRRADGYHNLQTLFQFVDLCDELSFETTQDSALTLDFPGGDIAPEQNLIFRAALALRQSTGCEQGAKIRVEKNIPMGGGLGGGSSNAATTLVALNTLWNLKLNTQTLCNIGVKLGADVPIFIHGHAAIATGVGEVFENVEISEPYYLLGVPPCHVPTARLFQEKQLTRDSRTITLCAFLNGEGHNDFEPVTRKLFPEVESTMKALNQVGKAQMTGTGACVFASFPSRNSAEAALGELSRICNQQPLVSTRWAIVRGLNKSPLYTGKLARQF